MPWASEPLQLYQMPEYKPIIEKKYKMVEQLLEKIPGTLFTFIARKIKTLKGVRYLFRLIKSHFTGKCDCEHCFCEESEDDKSDGEKSKDEKDDEKDKK